MHLRKSIIVHPVFHFYRVVISQLQSRSSHQLAVSQISVRFLTLIRWLEMAIEDVQFYDILDSELGRVTLDVCEEAHLLVSLNDKFS